MLFTRRLMLVFVLLLASLTITTALAAQESEPPHWTYEGEEGPESLGRTRCCVRDVRVGVGTIAHRFDGRGSFRFGWGADELSAVGVDGVPNNGHTVQVNYNTGHTLVVNGVTYELAQFHFHTPSNARGSTAQPCPWKCISCIAAPMATWR